MVGTQSSCATGGLALGSLWFSSGRGNGRRSVKFSRSPGHFTNLETLGRFQLSFWLPSPLPLFEGPKNARRGVRLSASLPLPREEWRSPAAASKATWRPRCPELGTGSARLAEEPTGGSVPAKPEHSPDFTPSVGSLLRAPLPSLPRFPWKQPRQQKLWPATTVCSPLLPAPGPYPHTE